MSITFQAPTQTGPQAQVMPRLLATMSAEKVNRSLATFANTLAGSSAGGSASAAQAGRVDLAAVRSAATSLFPPDVGETLVSALTRLEAGGQVAVPDGTLPTRLTAAADFAGPRLLQLRSDTGNGDGPDQPTGSKPKSPPWTPTPEWTAKVKQFVDSLARSRFHTSWYGWQLDISEETARLLRDILLGPATPILLTALNAAWHTAGGVLAVLGAAAAAVGGWFILAIGLYAGYLAAAISLSLTPRGVSIRGLWIPGVVWCVGQ
jgi:hypothetical protein